MDTLITLNLIGYAAVMAGGLVLGAMFGRNLATDFGAMVRLIDSRVGALELALHLTSPPAAAPAAAPAVEPAVLAIQSHAIATEKLAAAIEIHAAATKVVGS